MYNVYIYGKIIKYSTQLMDFLILYKLICQNQFGFQKGKSTIDAIHAFIQGIYDALDNGKLAIGLFYDMSKAFDCVDHNILTNTLEELGIRGLPLNWLRSFFMDRKQYVELYDSISGKGISSEMRENNIGIPQGTVLGPILYIIYVNFISDNLGPGIKALFADDTSHLITNSSLNSIVQSANSAVSNMALCCNEAK